MDYEKLIEFLVDEIYKKIQAEDKKSNYLEKKKSIVVMGESDVDFYKKALKELGGEVIGVACIADRTSAPIGMPIYSAIKLDIQVHEADDCPLCKEGKIELIKPGSREFKEIGM